MMLERLDAYHAADRGIALVDRSDRLRWSIEGPDRAKFLQNLTTNDVAGLEPDRGCEAFVTSPQGKTLAFVTLHRAGDRILLRSEVAAQAELEPHFAKYGIFDDVRWTDLGPSRFELHLAGPGTERLLDRLEVADRPSTDLGAVSTALCHRDTWLVREAPTGRPGYTIIGPRADLAPILDALNAHGRDLGLVACDGATFDLLRIEAGTPLFGRDVTSANLPQEVDRDRTAINFHKGCYLGQETVARIDALGHVNKVLRGLRFEPGEVPPPGTALQADGKPAGTVTSSAFSPGCAAPVGLGYVRRNLAAPGQVLRCMLSGADRAATVAALPLLQRDAP